MASIAGRQRTEGIKGWILKVFRIDLLKAQQKQVDKIKRSKKIRLGGF